MPPHESPARTIEGPHTGMRGRYRTRGRLHTSLGRGAGAWGTVHPRKRSPADRLLTRAALTWRKPADLDLSREPEGAVIPGISQSSELRISGIVAWREDFRTRIAYGISRIVGPHFCFPSDTRPAIRDMRRGPLGCGQAARARLLMFRILSAREDSSVRRQG